MKVFKLKGWKYRFNVNVAEVPEGRYAVDIFVSEEDKISLYGNKQEILEKIDEVIKILEMAKGYLIKK